MDNKTLAKLALLAKKDPAVAEKLVRQAEVISDDELERVAGGDWCFEDAINCVFDSACWTSAASGTDLMFGGCRSCGSRDVIRAGNRIDCRSCGLIETR